MPETKNGSYKTKKGFTLMELIIVIAIIGVLTAIMIPTWSYFISQSRIKSQNSNARIVFNVAQTECISYEFQERDVNNSIRYWQKQIDQNKNVENAKNMIAGYKSQLFMDSDFYFYWDGHKGIVCDDDCNEISGKSDAAIKEFSKKINSSLDDPATIVYKIHIENYQVKSVAAARTDSDTSIGTFPVAASKRSHAKIKELPMTNIEL